MTIKSEDACSQNRSATMIVIVPRLLLTLQWALAVTAVYVPKYPFLYATKDNLNASFPVIEHLSPEYRGLDKDAIDRPDFLYAPVDTYRIVEFYIHYCNTCKAFRPVYTKFAEKVKELAALQNVNNIDVYAISCSPNRKLCVDQGVKGFPKIRLYKPGESEFNELNHHTQIHPYKVLDQLGIDFDGEEEDWDVDSGTMEVHVQAPSWWQSIAAKLTGQSINSPRSPARRSRDDLKADIHLSLDYALRNEVYTHKNELSAEERRALRAFLDLLFITLPSSWELHNLLRELVDNFMFIAKSEDYLVAVLDEYPAPTEQWSESCSHGAPDEGYTCGMWELYHAITVGFVDYNRAVFDSAKLLATETAARVIRDFVDNFFGCETCRMHFVTSYDACAHDRCDTLSTEHSTEEGEWIKLPLWLYETHNAVNVRLLKERAARENRDISQIDIRAVKWPPVTECSACWKENDVWDTDMVFKYLRLEYGNRDASFAELRRELMAAKPILKENSKAHSKQLRLQLGHASLFVISMLGLNIGGRFQRKRTTKAA